MFWLNAYTAQTILEYEWQKGMFSSAQSDFIHVYVVLWHQQSKNHLCLMLSLVFKAPWKRKWPQQLLWNGRWIQMASIAASSQQLQGKQFLFLVDRLLNMEAVCWIASYLWTHYENTHVFNLKGLSEIGAKTASIYDTVEVPECITCTHSKRRLPPIVCFMCA